MARHNIPFLLNAALAFVGVMAFFAVYRRQHKRESLFKDDIWATPEQIRDALSKPENPRIAREVDQLALPAPEVKQAKTERAPYKTPNFAGKPHEVLGLPPNPSRKDVQLAFRYWIKRYHPDHVNHLGAEHVRQAVRRAEQLNRARAALLKLK